ncbi:MAG: ATP-binding protein [Anaerolineae bacterium]|nr:ATP-binding protein [Anaerolineae bacterium]
MMQIGAEATHEAICNWIKKHYPPHAEVISDLMIANSATANITALSYVGENYGVGDGFLYRGYDHHDCDMISPVTTYFDLRPAQRSGGMCFHFESDDANFDVLVLSAWVYDADMNNNLMCIASVPQEHMQHWLVFEKEVQRIYQSAIPYRGKVYIVGGVETTFDATIHWDEIYLPEQLKTDILQDIDAFFEKGVDIYTRLNIKPFRKLLFAGVPGTGKTMLCSAIAGWGQEKDYFVVYVSGSNQYGAKFWKIHEALEMAASSDAPTIIIVEELDSYLDDDDKAQLLNVLDGSESPTNKHGTIMIATTNHPEKIDDRVMKRPGRLDRIFIIPEMEHEETARLMLMQYLGDAWQEDHRQIVPKLLGRPGAFIREVALYALTMAAYRGETELSLEMLRDSLDTLVNQIEAKDGFLTSHKKQPMGLAAERKAKRNGFRIHDE